MQVVVLVVTLAIGVVLGAWYPLYLTRPKLRVTGGGSSGGPAFHTTSVHLTNQPGLLGLKLKETVIFGKLILKPRERGLSFDRKTAKDCRAILYDKATGQEIALLWWRPAGDGTGGMPITVAIESGESRDLVLFARLDNEPTKYFIFAPDGDGLAPRIPLDELKFNATHEFEVRVLWSNEHQELSFDVSVQKGFDGRLQWKVLTSGGSF